MAQSYPDIGICKAGENLAVDRLDG